MRVLTVRQPWAWAIIHGGKDIENRSRSLGQYRGPVAIHAGKSFGSMIDYAYATRTIRRIAGALPREEPTGVIIGVVDLIDAHDSGDCFYESPPDRHCSPWAEDDTHHLVLATPRRIDPIPAKGRLGLWKPDEDLLAQIMKGHNHE